MALARTAATMRVFQDDEGLNFVARLDTRRPNGV
jgi:hypothetical protein